MSGEEWEAKNPDEAKDMYLLTHPITETYEYLDNLRLSCKFHRERDELFSERKLKQDIPSFLREMEEFKDVNKTKLKFRIKDLKYLVQALK